MVLSLYSTTNDIKKKNCYTVVSIAVDFQLPSNQSTKRMFCQWALKISSYSVLHTGMIYREQMVSVIFRPNSPLVQSDCPHVRLLIVDTFGNYVEHFHCPFHNTRSCV